MRKLFGGRFDMPKALKTVCGKLFRIFSPNKCAPEKKEERILHIQAVCRRMMRLERLFLLSSKELGTLLKKFKIKN
jgi:hypothetical protein